EEIGVDPRWEVPPAPVEPIHDDRREVSEGEKEKQDSATHGSRDRDAVPIDPEMQGDAARTGGCPGLHGKNIILVGCNIRIDVGMGGSRVGRPFPPHHKKEFGGSRCYLSRRGPRSDRLRRKPGLIRPWRRNAAGRALGGRLRPKTRKNARRTFAARLPPAPSPSRSSAPAWRSTRERTPPSTPQNG